MNIVRVLVVGLTTFSLGSLQSAAQTPEAPEPETWSQWSITTGIDYSKGDYGASEDTTILFAPLTLKYELERFQFSATVPYVWMKGPQSVAGGAQTGDDNPVVSNGGIGDITLAATFNIYPKAKSNLPFVELTAKVKIPTADTQKYLGTGSTDVTLQVDAFKSFGRVTPFVMAGYKFRGDADADVFGTLKLKDSLIGSVGAIVKISKKVNVGGSIDYATKSSTIGSDSAEITPFIVYKPVDQWSLMAYGTIGLSDANANSGIGVQVKRRF